MEDAIAMAEVKVLQAQVEELQAEYLSAEVNDLVRAAVVQEHLALLESRLQEAKRKLDELEVTSTTSGRFVPVRQGDLEGMFVRKGELLGYVLGNARPTIRTIVNQQDYLLVRDRNRDVQGVFAEEPRRPVQLALTRQVPAASDKLPSRALSQAGGGDSYLDPSDKEGNRALQSYFEFELAVQDNIPLPRSGGRVYVRFDLGGEPLFWRMYRSVRRLFLREFAI
jgi:putative peptide zinc metalloprotease protein